MGYGIREDMLAAFLLERGISQHDLAALARVTDGTITNAKKGRCRLETIQQIVQRGAQITDYRRWLRPEDLARLDGPKITSGVALVPLCMFHRRRPKLRDKYYRAALASGGRVLYISVMSRRSFKLLEENLSEDTQLQVLTWNPASVEEIVAFSKHLQEEGDKLDQTQGALEKWAKLERDQANIEVRTYESTPTMQGIVVEKQWAMIELMPYGRGPSLRPAILLRYREKAERMAFLFFADAFQSLFNASKDRKPSVRSSWFRSDGTSVIASKPANIGEGRSA